MQSNRFSRWNLLLVWEQQIPRTWQVLGMTYLLQVHIALGMRCACRIKVAWKAKPLPWSQAMRPEFALSADE